MTKPTAAASIQRSMISFPVLFFRRCRRIQILALAFLCLLPFAHGEDVTLTFTVPSARTAPGVTESVWLNALNASSADISWTFPPTIETRVVAAPGLPGLRLELRYGATNAITIPAGSFVRGEYFFTMPSNVAGQVVLEFPKLNANRIVLEVEPVTSIADTTNRVHDSFFRRYLTDAEPMTHEHAFGPAQFFKEHISGYEPLYFIGGSSSPNVKFQISFKYQLLNTYGGLAEACPPLKGFHIAYTQTSLWNLNGGDPAFYDTSYKPELLYLWERVIGGHATNWFRLDLQTGLQHESNGKGGVDEHSLNIGYIQPRLTFGRDDDFQLTLQPRAWVYLGQRYHNDDIADYRGYVDLRATVGWRRGLQLSALGRMGQDGDHRSIQLDLTYPTMRFFGSFSLYLDIQYYRGYGESLLGYNQETDAWRFGFSLFR